MPTRPSAPAAALRRLAAVLAALLLLCSAGWTAAAQPTLTIAAGAGYKRPLDELAAAFARRSGIRIEAFYGNMGQVLAQSGANDRVALVFGDQAFLAGARQVAFSRYLPAGRGRLVLAWPAGRSFAAVEQLTAAGVRRIALPDPRHAVYGKAASQFLARSALEAPLRQRLLTVTSVPQVAAYLLSGEVDAGFLNLSEALALGPRLGGYREIDPQLYDEVHIVAGLVAGREQLPGVAALADFLASAEARATLARYGL